MELDVSGRGPRNICACDSSRRISSMNAGIWSGEFRSLVSSAGSVIKWCHALVTIKAVVSLPPTRNVLTI